MKDKIPPNGKPDSSGRVVPPQLLSLARTLRKNSTDAERLLWYLLRNRQLLGFKFRRQHPVGQYVLDFYCHELRLAVELDGGQHNESSVLIKDERRTAFLNNEGISVMRFWNDEVLRETDVVLEKLCFVFDRRADSGPHPGPLPEGEGVGEEK